LITLDTKGIQEVSDGTSHTGVIGVVLLTVWIFQGNCAITCIDDVAWITCRALAIIQVGNFTQRVETGTFSSIKEKIDMAFDT